MIGLSLPKKEVLFTYCNPNVGSFAIDHNDGKVAHWDHCREQFAAKFNDKVDAFFFSHKIDKSLDIALFTQKFESIIHESNPSIDMSYTEFSQTTTSDNILYIKPSSFWKDCFFKKSLYTLILRCAQNYDHVEDNFDDALFGMKYKETVYLLETKMAVLRFMFGFTKYTGISPVLGEATVIKHGWKEEFYKLDENQIRERLVLPETVKKFHNIVGCDSLWV